MTFPDTGTSPVQIALSGGVLDGVRAWRCSTSQGATHPGAGRPGAVLLAKAGGLLPIPSAAGLIPGLA